MLTCTRLRRLEQMVKDLKAARDADLTANSTLFIRVHNLEQRVAPAEDALPEINMTASYMMGYKAGKEAAKNE